MKNLFLVILFGAQIATASPLRADEPSVNQRAPAKGDGAVAIVPETSALVQALHDNRRAYRLCLGRREAFRWQTARQAVGCHRLITEYEAAQDLLRDYIEGAD